MRLRPDQLATHLRKALASLYLVHGEEVLLAQEAADAIRVAARERGHVERECLTVSAGFDWNALRQSLASPSLFASRRLLELRLGDAKPGETGSKALIECAARPAADVVLLVTAGKLDWQVQKGRWFTALESAGVAVAAQAVEARQLPAWIERRMRSRGLNPTADAVALLSERMEGNLLAAAQEIEKLLLLTDGQPLGAEAILLAVGDCARYNIYDWVEAALLGQPERTARILSGLRGEGVEPALVNWALHREIRTLAALAFARDRRQGLEAVFAAHKVWEKRKPTLLQASQRLDLAGCRRLLRDCARADRLIKGIEPGSPWEALLDNGLRLAGVALLPDRPGWSQDS